MAAKVQRVAVQAAKTFSKFVSRKHFHENWNALKESVNQITAVDLNLDYRLLQDTSPYNADDVTSGAPVTYIHIWEDNVFTMGIFVLRNGVRLPMHDHPGMYGVLKIIHGTAKIRSFSKCEINCPVPKEVLASRGGGMRTGAAVIAAKRQSDGVHSPEHGLCALTPADGNMHEIQALDGPAAFLDVLAPPYDPAGGRECHYFKEFKPDSKDNVTSTTSFGTESRPMISVSNSTTHGGKDSPIQKDSGVTWLVEVAQPDEFWCESAPYRGPVIKPYQTE